MATTFYVPHLGVAPAVSPAYSAGWEKTSGAAREKAVTAKTNTALLSVQIAGNGTSGHDVLTKQLVSDPLAAQTIAVGTLTGQVKCFESNATDNYGPQIRVYVYRPSNTSVVGVVYEMDTYTPGGATPPEFATSGTNRKFPQSGSAGTTSAVTTADYDVLVIELGYRAGSTAVNLGTLKCGDPIATADLPVDETTTADGDAWIQLSQTLIFAAAANIATASQTIPFMGTPDLRL